MFENFKADGTQGEELRRATSVVTGRQYNGNPGLDDWGASPTVQTTLFRDRCVPEQERPWEDCSFGDYDCQEDSTYVDCPQPYNEPIPFEKERKYWTSESRLNGKSWLTYELMQPWYDSEDLSTRFYKQIPKVEVLVRGVKLTFIRWKKDGQAFAVDGDGNRIVETVTEWSDNPIAALYWYDTVRRGIAADRFDQERIADAYEVCEEVVAYGDADIPDSHAYLRGHASLKRYSCNIEIESGMEPAEVYATILATCAGVRFETNGKIVYRAGEDRQPTLTLTDEDFVEVQSVKPWPALDERINTINVTLDQSEGRGWKADTLSFRDPAAAMRDGETRAIERRLAGVQNHIQAGAR